MKIRHTYIHNTIYTLIVNFIPSEFSRGKLITSAHVHNWCL